MVAAFCGARAGDADHDEVIGTHRRPLRTMVCCLAPTAGDYADDGNTRVALCMLLQGILRPSIGFHSLHESDPSPLTWMPIMTSGAIVAMGAAAAVALRGGRGGALRRRCVHPAQRSGGELLPDDIHVAVAPGKEHCMMSVL